MYLIILHVVFLTDDKTMDEDSKKREFDNLNLMVAYCQNSQDCRRKQLLTYFDEVAIEANSCNEETEAICDNCERANVSKPLCFNLTLSTKPVCRCQY